VRKQGRKCQGCGDITRREAMFKITRNAQGEVFLDPPSNFTGRSCYICKNPDCVQMVIKKKRISRALKTPHNSKILEIEGTVSNLATG